MEQNINTSKDWTKIVLACLVDQMNSLGGDKTNKKSSNISKEESFRSSLRKLEYL